MSRGSDWEQAASSLLRTAANESSLVGRLTPLDFCEQTERAVEHWQRGQRTVPRFRYGPRPANGLAGLVAQRVPALRRHGVLGNLYADRAEELHLELAIGSAVGTGRVRALTRERFARSLRSDADRLAHAWIEATPSWGADGSSRGTAPPLPPRSDDAEPVPLFEMMCREIERLQLPWEVRAVDQMAARAAVGAEVLYVQARCRLAPTEVARLVVHEVHGHVLPRWRASRCPIGLLAIGTARGTDDQEGYALVLEEACGLLGASRRGELGRRHLAAATVHAGADFVETTEALLAADTPTDHAVRLAARVHRGGGLGREIVYLPAYLEATTLARGAPARFRMLGSGTVAVDTLEPLEPWLAGVMPQGPTGSFDALREVDGWRTSGRGSAAVAVAAITGGPSWLTS